MPIQPLDRIRGREWAFRWGSLWLLHVLGLAPLGLVSGRREDRCALRPGREPPMGPFGHPAFRRKLRTPNRHTWALRDHVGTFVLARRPVHPHHIAADHRPHSR